MRAAWFVARTQLRARWGSVIVLTLIVGLTGAVVIASLAGARRTSTAVERFRDETLAADLTVFVPATGAATLDELRRLPGVESIGIGRQLTATIDGSFDAAVGGPLDDHFGRTVDRARVLEGRLPRAGRVHEVAVPEPLARASRLRVGDTVTLNAFSPEQVQAIIDGIVVNPGKPEGPEVSMRIVGITRVPGDLSFEGDTGGVVFTTPAFVAHYGDQIGSFSPTVLRVRTSDDDAGRRFVQEARRLTAPGGAEGEFQVQPTSETEGGVGESIDVVATGLLVFALVAAVAGVVVVSVAIRRFVDGGASDLPALRGLGMAPGTRALALGLSVLPVAVAGAVVAVLGAWLASPLFPLGLARRAEPHLGLDIDPLLLGVGLLLVAGVVAAVALLAASRVVRSSARSREFRVSRPSVVADTLNGAGVPPAIVVGLTTVTTHGAGRAGSPSRPAIAGTVVAVLGIVAVGIVGASITHLGDTPRAYGYNWDAHLVVRHADRADETYECNPSEAAAIHDRALAAVTDVCSDTIEVEGYSVNGVGFMRLKGDLGPTVLAGRAPRAPGEVALGTATMRHAHARIGDRVHISGPSGDARYRVVGRVALPFLASLDEEGTDLQAVADGAAFTGNGLAKISSHDGENQARLLVNWRDGADIDAASKRIDRLRGGNPPLGPAVPLEVDRIEQVRVLPWLLGGFLALIGALGIAYGLVTSVRRRERDVAVLKTVGFRRAEIGVSVATQATTYGIVGLVVGVPLGVLVGRLTWDRIASRSGFAVFPVLSLPVVAAVVVGTLVLVNVVAWFPGRRAARLRPATVLRSE